MVLRTFLRRFSYSKGQVARGNQMQLQFTNNYSSFFEASFNALFYGLQLLKKALGLMRRA